MNLAGKDYFSEPEAAHYCCVSLSQFRRYAVQAGIEARWFMGRKIYRRADLARAMEHAWQPFAPEALPGFSHGPSRRAASAEKRSERLR